VSAPPVLLKGVSRSFANLPALEEVDLLVEEGDFLGIIGPNGGGKTVLLKVILGLIRPDRGSVRIFGRPPRDARGLVGYVPQSPRFDPTFPMRVLDVVSMGRLRQAKPFRGYTRHDRERALRALEQVDMADMGTRQVGKLSGGQIQRVLIARALVDEPRLLLLDEPTASLDTPGDREFYEILQRLPEETAIVLVTHDLGIVHSYVKTIACLNGRLHYHHAKEITREMVEEAYGCPVDFVVHPHTHRILEPHPEEE
jgi:zinc transport system ATP-binding protein